MAFLDSLVSHYKMNSDWLDSKGTNDGTAYGGATFDTTTPKLGSGSGVFDGVDDYVEITNSLFTYLDGDPFSISLWVKPNTTGSRQIFYNPASIIDAWIEIDTSGNWIFHTWDGSSADNLSGGAASTSWTHLVAVYDGTDKYFYVDNGSPTTSTPVTVISKIGATNFGRWSGDGFYLDGSLDDVRIYSKALTQAEVSALYFGGRGTEATYAEILPTESMSLSDNLTQRHKILPTESITLSDSELKKVTKSRKESLTLSDSQIKKVTKSRSESITLSDSELKKVTKSRSESLTISDILSQRHKILPTEQMNLEDRLGNKYLNDKLIAEWSSKQPTKTTWTEKTPPTSTTWTEKKPTKTDWKRKR